MRKLSQKFMFDLKEGVLLSLLDAVKQDDTLCLKIRNGYINIYYRGGSLLKVTESSGGYKLEFDKKFFINENWGWSKDNFKELNSIKRYIDAIPFLKREMNYWLYKHPKLEREHQQIILRDNNSSSITNETDYYITDIEYADSENGSRFDLVGIRWISGSRRNIKLPSLALFELKYGDGSLASNSGIYKHFSDLNKFCSDGRIKSLLLEAQTQFNQKVELGLIKDMDKYIEINAEEKPEYILLFANHKPTKSVLKRELKKAYTEYPNLSEHFDIKVATASFIGYGLYSKNMIPIDEFIKEWI